MRVSFRNGLVPLVLFVGSITGWPATSKCGVGSLEGEVQAGGSFVRPIGNGLEVMLEPLASGWILRILPEGKPRPPHDYAELATPPYRSINPLLITTDYSFRAQDVVGWNPRRFRFAPDDASFFAMSKSYNQYEGKGAASTSAQQALAKLVSEAPEGMLTILDTKLVPGTADQVPGAASVATHFSTTAHTIEKPANGEPSPLGRVTWMRFRIVLELPAGFHADNRLRIAQQPCAAF